jgi:hypothetical protein
MKRSGRHKRRHADADNKRRGALIGKPQSPKPHTHTHTHTHTPRAASTHTLPLLPNQQTSTHTPHTHAAKRRQKKSTSFTHISDHVHGRGSAAGARPAAHGQARAAGRDGRGQEQPGAALRQGAVLRLPGLLLFGKGGCRELPNPLSLSSLRKKTCVAPLSSRPWRMAHRVGRRPLFLGVQAPLHACAREVEREEEAVPSSSAKAHTSLPSPSSPSLPRHRTTTTQASTVGAAFLTKTLPDLSVKFEIW